MMNTQTAEGDRSSSAGAAMATLASFSDAVALRHARGILHEELKRLTMYDALTGLPNRTLLRDRVELALAAAERDGTAVGVVMLDLKSLKGVNDARGHAAGDAVLRTAAERLSGVLSPVDTVARWGGDEFAVVLARAGTISCAHAVADELRRAILVPMEIGEHLIGMDVSAGVAVGIRGADALLRNAELALASAKRTRVSIRDFDVAEHRAAMDRLALVNGVTTALVNGEFELHYQPIVDASTGTCTAAEALVRWRHPTRGLLAAAEFIPAVEGTPAMASLGAWILERALADCAGWRGAHDVRVSVNVAMRQLDQTALPAMLAALAVDHGLSPGAVTMEITETGALVDPGPVFATLSALRRAGVRVSIDDFGSGYASIGYLRRLPLDELKIDRSFVLAATDDQRSLAMVKATIELAHSLGLQVVAEGVEDQRARDLMVGLGCDRLQGFAISRPMPVDALVAWLDRPAARPLDRSSATLEARDQFERLSPRERQVVAALGTGRSNAQIAQQLGLSTTTVRSHVQHVLEKLSAHTRLEVVVRATRSGLLDLVAQNIAA